MNPSFAVLLIFVKDVEKMYGGLMLEILNKYGITQKQFADELELTQQFVSDIRRDKSKIPQRLHGLLIKRYNASKFYLESGMGDCFAPLLLEKIKFNEELSEDEATLLQLFSTGIITQSLEVSEKLKSILSKTNVKMVSVSEFENILRNKENSLVARYKPLKIDKYEFGLRVNKIRIRAELTSPQMAEIIDINERELAALISGEGKITLELIQKICENFDVTADWLLFGKE